jgi:hypothetical protein
LVLSKWAESEDPGYEKLRSLQMSRLMGAEVGVAGQEEAALVEDRMLRIWRGWGGRGIGLPSLHGFWRVGDVRWMLELSETEGQMREKGELGGSELFDMGFLTCVSWSTLGGMFNVMKLLERVSRNARRAVVPR